MGSAVNLAANLAGMSDVHRRRASGRVLTRGSPARIVRRCLPAEARGQPTATRSTTKMSVSPGLIAGLGLRSP
jgi:hypothetical protein